MLIKVMDGTPVELLSKGSEKKVLLRCDKCGHEGTTNWANYRRSQSLRKNTGTTYCRRCANTINPRRGHTAWNKGKFKPLSERKRTRYTDAHGYVMVYIPKPGSARGWIAYHKEHKIVLEAHLGRKLKKHEVVHHIDGRRDNNRLTNLWLTTHAGHRDAHTSLQHLGYRLCRAGLVSFKRGNYKANQKLLELLEQLEAANQQPSRRGSVGRSND